MEYTNISKEKFKKDFTDREGVVIKFAGVKYPDEVLRHCLITLQNTGFNTNFIIRPKVITTGKNMFDAVFMVAKSHKMSDSETVLLMKWAQQFPVYTPINKYVK